MMDKKTDVELEAFFDAAKAVADQPETVFLQTLMADAQQQTALRTKTTKTVAATVSLTGLLRKIGGWQPLMAMTACAVFGLYVGYSTPDSLDYLNNTQQNTEAFSNDSFSVASEIEALFQEG